MAVHFDFIVSDIDAETILSCIQQEAINCMVGKMEVMCRTDLTLDEQKSTVAWYESRRKYLNNLSDTIAKSTKQVFDHDH